MRIAFLTLTFVLAAACQPQAEAPIPETTPAPVVAPTLGGVDLSAPMRALGTEPFWGVEITPGALVFTGVDRAEIRAPNPGAQMHGDAAIIAAPDAALAITLRAEQCSDGMSDRVYALKADVVLGGETLSGCADSQAALDAMPKP